MPLGTLKKYTRFIPLCQQPGGEFCICLRAFLSLAASGAAQAFKERRGPRVRGVHALGVPLDAQKERQIGMFQRFHDAVARLSRYPQAGRRVAHRLMMERVDPQRPLAHDARQQRALPHRDLVAGIAPRSCLRVQPSFGPLAGQVLIQRAAQRRIHGLNAPADAQKRHAPPDAKPLEFCSLGGSMEPRLRAGIGKRRFGDKFFALCIRSKNRRKLNALYGMRARSRRIRPKEP